MIYILKIYTIQLTIYCHSKNIAILVEHVPRTVLPLLHKEQIFQDRDNEGENVLLLQPLLDDLHCLLLPGT